LSNQSVLLGECRSIMFWLSWMAIRSKLMKRLGSKWAAMSVSGGRIDWSVRTFWPHCVLLCLCWRMSRRKRRTGIQIATRLEYHDRNQPSHQCHPTASPRSCSPQSLPCGIWPHIPEDRKWRGCIACTWRGVRLPLEAICMASV